MKTKKPTRPRHLKRKLHIGGKVWTYHIGGLGVTIRHPDGFKTTKVLFRQIWNIPARLMVDRRRREDGIHMKPSEIKTWIENNLCEKNNK